MTIRMSYWLLLTGPYVTDTYKDWEGHEWSYEITPGSKVKKGDTVYLWRVSDNDMYGWAVVLETPRISEHLDSKGRRQLIVTVIRKVGFEPTLTRQQIETDRSLIGLIPSTPEELFAVPLETLQAYHLNDVIRSHGLDAPEGSAPVSWSVEDALYLVDSTLYEDKREFPVVISDITLEVKRYLAEHPERLYDLNPRKFEELVADILKDFGFDVELTGVTRDNGRDIYAYTRNAITSFLMFVECKRWRPPKHVGIEVVQRIHGACESGGADKGMIVTTSFFTGPAVSEQHLISAKLELRNYNDLKQWLERYR